MRCIGTIMEDCNYEDPINIIYNLKDNECQKHCDISKECRFYNYDSESKRCQLYREVLDDFLKLCKTRGNPKDCQPPAKNCVSFSFNLNF